MEWAMAVANTTFPDATRRLDHSVLERWAQSPEASAVWLVYRTDSTLDAIDTLPPRLDPPAQAVLALYKPPGAVEDAQGRTGYTYVPGGDVINSLSLLVATVVGPCLAGGEGTLRSAARHRAAELVHTLAALQYHREIPFVELRVEPQTALADRDLDALQKCAARWKRDIRTLTTLDRDVDSGTTSEEASFWLTLESALVHAQRQLESTHVRDAFTILREGKRFHATANFVSDTGVAEALATAQSYTPLFRDWPLGELLSSPSVAEISPRLEVVLNSFTRRLRASGYPVHRAVQVVEAVSRDLAHLVSQFIPGEIMELDTATLAHIDTAALEWDACVRDFSATARDVMRRRAERFVPVRITGAHSGIIARLRRANQLRTRHHEFLNALSPPQSDEVRRAWNEAWAGASVTEPADQWQRRERAYADAVSSTDTAIAASLRQQLSQASDAGAMFEAFTKLGGTLVARPAVQAAVREFQAALVLRIRDDITSLRRQITQTQPTVAAEAMGPAATRLVWLRQLNKRLEILVTRISGVLGGDWEQHADAQALVDDVSTLREQLDAEKYVRQWLRQAPSPDAALFDAEASVFGISTQGTRPVIVSGVDESVLLVLEDARALRALGVTLPPTLLTTASRGHRLALHARALAESLRVMMDVRYRLEQVIVQDRRPAMRLERAVYSLVEQGLTRIRWTDEVTLSKFVGAFERATWLWDRQATRVLEIEVEVKKRLRELNEVPASTVPSLVHELASITEPVSSPAYSLSVFSEARQRAAHRLADLLRKWRPQTRIHRLLVTAHGLVIEPPVEESKREWLRLLNAEIEPFAFAWNVNGVSGTDIEGENESVEAFAGAVKRIMKLAASIDAYSRHWLEFQALWDIETPLAILESYDLRSLTTFFSSFRSSLASLSNSNSGATTSMLDTSQARSAIESRATEWLAELAPPFTERVGRACNERAIALRKARKSLETMSLEAESLLPLEVGASEVESGLPLDSVFESELVTPNVETGVDQSKAELQSLSEIVQIRMSAIEAQSGALVVRMRENEGNLRVSLTGLIDRWQRAKPVQGALDPTKALEICYTFESDLESLIDRQAGLESTARILSVPSGVSRGDLAAMSGELDELKTMWMSIRTSYDSLTALDAIPWSTEVSVTEIAASLTRIQQSLSDVPPRLVPYAAYTELSHRLDFCVKRLKLVEKLTNPAIGVQHMIRIFGKVPATLGEIWSISATIDMAVVGDVISAAEAEGRLIGYLEDLERKWESQMLEQTSSGLLRGLTSALRVAEDHAAVLSSMHSSPYFHAVEAAVSSWERRLDSHTAALTALADAQRKYVRLRGVFAPRGLSSTQPLHLRQESQRFSLVAKEATSLFDTIAGRPALSAAESLETNLAPAMRRFQGQLAALQRTLSSYLVTQRAEFPRLYFVGDDAVLEICGTGMIEPHLSKLFSGISSFEKDEQGRITGVRSAEGELLRFLEATSSEEEPLSILRATEIQCAFAFKKATADALSSWPEPGSFVAWLQNNLCEAVVLALRIKSGHSTALDELADYKPQIPLERRRLEIVIVELLHMNKSGKKLAYSYQSFSGALEVSLNGTTLNYGWEWPGTPAPLVRTPLTDRFLSASMLAISLGGATAPFGPAGTGKTESVKWLGIAMGRRVVVINCDDTFDFVAMATSLNGAALTGAWVCFDEFNRLEAGVLSAVATEISESPAKAFITMNPTYRGRQKLPTNLRQQYRSFAMTRPDSEVIAEVLLRAGGFGTNASTVAVQAVQTLEELSRRLRPQDHYDWSLRSLKAVLRICADVGSLRFAFEMVIRPRLVSCDIQVLDDLLSKMPGFSETQNHDDIARAAEKLGLDPTEYLILKCTQMRALGTLHSGLMLVGNAATGKSSTLAVAASLENAVVTRIDASVVPKTVLLGILDDTTREWTDGIIPPLLRDTETTHWIVFDGPIEPVWAEAFNSLLDDNMTLSLPSGERIPLPPRHRIIFETGEVGAATPATVSRCGLVWFDSEVPWNHLVSSAPSLPSGIVEVAEAAPHTMEWSLARAAAFYNALGPRTGAQESLALAWAFSGDSPSSIRSEISSILSSDVDLTSCYISELTGDILSWSEAVPDPDPNSEEIPTADTAAHEALVVGIESGPLCFVGPPGSGKTMVTLSALRHMDIDIITLTLSQEASPATVIRALESHCSYGTGGLVLAPPAGRSAVLFIDEINLPAPNMWGSRPVLGLVRSLIEHRGFWRGTSWVRIERIRIIAAGNPPGMRAPLPPRLLRHFAVVEVGYPSESALKSIYGTMLNRTIGPSAFSGSLLDSMLEVYSKLPKELGFYSPRELTRWVQGLAGAYNSCGSEGDLPRIWAHEGLRLFGDRLIDPTPIVHLLKEVAADTLGDRVDPGSLCWTWLLGQTPQFSTRNEIRRLLEARVASYLDEIDSTQELVVHDSFVDHVLRLERVLRQARGHLMLAGPTGVGKSTLVRFVCWLLGIDAVWLSTWRGYGEREFHSDLKRVVLRSLDRPTCLILPESAGLRSEFLENMNTLLANAEVPGLFEPLSDEWREIEARYSAAGGAYDIAAWLRAQIGERLHIVFIVSDFNGEVASPALLNRCVQNWVGDWQAPVRAQIARAYLRWIDVSPSVIDLLVSFKATPAEFREILEVYIQTYKSKKSALETRQRHLIRGGDRIKAAVMDVGRLRRSLGEQEQELLAKDDESRAVLAEMLANQSEAERRREAGVTIRAALADQRSAAKARRIQVREELASVHPVVESAARGVRNIRKAHLTELRALANPPEAVKLTLETVCLVLGLIEQPSRPGTADWRKVQHAARSDGFVTRILEYEGMHEQIADVIVESYARLPAFSIAAADRASKAAGPLVAWVLAQVNWQQARKSVEPLMLEIEKLDKVAREREAQLEAIEQMLDELEVKIESTKREYAKVIAETEQLKYSMAHVRSQLTRASGLLESLQDERSRWSAQVASFDSSIGSLAGDVVVGAVYSAIAGSLDLPERDELVETITRSLAKAAIPYGVVDIPAFLGNADDGNLAILQSLRLSVPLVIDPFGRWIAPATSVRASCTDSPGLFKRLETALKLGQTLVVDHAEVLDPVLAPLLSPLGICQLPQGAVTAAPGFRLILYSTDASTSVSGTTKVSYEITSQTLQRMVRDELVRLREPELASRRRRLLDSRASTSCQLSTLEDDLLEALQGSELLENDALLTSLETLKSETTALEAARADSDATLTALDNAVAAYDHACACAAQVWDLFSKLSNEEPLYTFGVEFLWAALRFVAQDRDVASALVREVWRRAAPALLLERRQLLKASLSKICEFRATDPLDFESIVRQATSSQPVVVGIVGDADILTPEGATTIAMGTRESAAKADRLVAQASTNGFTLIVQNADLDISWLNSLVERWNSLSSRADVGFRLVLTFQFPAEGAKSLLGTIGAWPFICEPPPGIRMGLRQLKPKTPRDAKVAWLHCALSTHKWHKTYDFLFSDYIAALAAARVDPDLVVDAVYGAKMENATDLTTIRLLVQQALGEEWNVPLVPPPGSDIDEWIGRVPDSY